jgi:hypothetical protein
MAREQGTGGGDLASPLLFREVQPFRMWMFWVPIVVVTGVVWYEFYEQIIRSNPPGTQPLPDWAAWVLTIVFGIGLPIFGLSLKLITQVFPKEITVGLFPFRPAHIPLDSITEAEAREYSAQREYGGWGIRTTSRGGKAYTAYGRTGVQLWLKGDERILIGTQRADELGAALKQAGVFVR